ncbi:uncharacterized protein LOC128198271 [Bicyclus anynana]|uniref:Uncharacterized protein LOC128198271 n=1 Tax=Bicyclus anynana TaxID=110368 RepID=A0ABM3LHR9_BICAN|nr:uncharacterized protein LOC128198271 [Bicyclus anynana]
MNAQGVLTGADEVRRIRTLAQSVLVERWKEDLESSIAGSWTVLAVCPHIERWLKKKHGTLTFRLVQILTGHGCFGKYLHQTARRELTPVCHQCGATEDTAHHTLAECAAWSPQRHILSSTIGRAVSLPDVVDVMIGSETCWSVMLSFCEAVMGLKEDEERAREEAADAPVIRRRRQAKLIILVAPSYTLVERPPYPWSYRLSQRLVYACGTEEQLMFARRGRRNRSL